MRNLSRLGLLSAVPLGGYLLSHTTAQASTTTLCVEEANPVCTNSGSGTADQPFCTINKAASVAVAGQTYSRFTISGTVGPQCRRYRRGHPYLRRPRRLRILARASGTVVFFPCDVLPMNDRAGTTSLIVGPSCADGSPDGLAATMARRRSVRRLAGRGSPEFEHEMSEMPEEFTGGHVSVTVYAYDRERPPLLYLDLPVVLSVRHRGSSGTRNCGRAPTVRHATALLSGNGVPALRTRHWR